MTIPDLIPEHVRCIISNNRKRKAPRKTFRRNHDKSENNDAADYGAHANHPE
ncbi:hypothetical protein RP20_CCG025592 [Aedes albopictus]|nr:hypothetical protein RP20_CCG025592 [Aedes albopictus]